VRVPALPELDGVAFRMFEGASDYPDFARIITAASKALADDRVETPEQIASGYDNLQRCDPARDLLVAEMDSVVVAYSRVWWDEEAGGPHLYKHICFVDPAVAGAGIGAALFAWNEDRLREIARDHEVAEQLFEVWNNDRNVAAGSLIGASGYEPITYSAEMVRPTVDHLPDHRLPDGLELRPVREEDIRAIWEADQEAGRDHWGFVKPTEADYRRFLAFPYRDISLWKVAWDDEGVAGQVKSFINTASNDAHGKTVGWTEEISTARRWRRRGVAKALIVESIRELAARGMTEVALSVHTENPNGAFDLYTGLGYQVVANWTTYRKPL
jgi:GNAT superfamily N-acetyltransferase